PCNPPAETIYKNTVLLTVLLSFLIYYAGSRAPGDTFLLLSRDEFWPFTVIDRRGRIIGGGAFDVGTFGGDAADYDRVCQPVGSTIGEPLFMTMRSEEHTSELQSRENLVCRLLLEKKK